MKKWTTTTNAQPDPLAASSGHVTLSKVLQRRGGGGLSDLQCWAILGQAGHALQDVLLSINSRRRLRRVSTLTVSSHKNEARLVKISPDKLALTSTGRIVLTSSTAEFNDRFGHPVLAQKLLQDQLLSERELEIWGVHSLAKTVQSCLNSRDHHKNSRLQNLLSQLLQDHPQVSLLLLLKTVSSEWQNLVGSAPISMYVAQLATSTSPDNDISIIEFSRIDSASSISSSSAPPSPSQAPSPLCSSSPNQVTSNMNLNNNNHFSNKYGRRLDYRPSSLESPKKRKVVQRNPSRLYRVVKPLTEILSTPAPATSRCIGPEFVVMNEQVPVSLDLCLHQSKREECRTVNVIMLDGQRLSIRCNPSSITANDVLDAALRERDVKEGNWFGLAVLRDTEYWLMSNEIKLCKVAPAGWKEGKSGHESFNLYQRFRFHPDNVDDDLKDGHNKHLLYLQLRRDLLDGKYRGITANMYFSLAGMALQVEFGDFCEDVHGDGDYFMLEHYLPSFLLVDLERDETKSSLVKLHRAHLGQSQSKTELKFCRELQRLDNFGFHFFRVQEEKSKKERLVALHMRGLFLFEPSRDMNVGHKILGSFFWRHITRIQYDKNRFQLVVTSSTTAPAGSEEKLVKLKFFVANCPKAKLMFDLASAHHQQCNRLKRRYESSSQVSSDEEQLHRLDYKDVLIEYKEPSKQKAMRSLKNKFLSRRQLSQRKLYTSAMPTTAPTLTSASNGAAKPLKRAVSVKDNYQIKRLTHYSSMANDLQDLNHSDKENTTPLPEKQYRYKVYLEPEDDEQSVHHAGAAEGEQPTCRLPLQEKPISSILQDRRRRSETAFTRPRIKTTTSGYVNDQANGGSAVLRMGTRISLSALHRERLRLTSDLGLPITIPSTKQVNRKIAFDDDLMTMERKNGLDDVITMENKPILPVSTASDVDMVTYPSNESLSESLIERFDQMETEQSEPERQIVSVSILKDPQGRLGLKITGTPSGIYVEDFDDATIQIVGVTRLKRGDRIVAINGRSLENVSYGSALELVKKSGRAVQFLVSQIT